MGGNILGLHGFDRSSLLLDASCEYNKWLKLAPGNCKSSPMYGMMKIQYDDLRQVGYLPI